MARNSFLSHGVLTGFFNEKVIFFGCSFRKRLTHFQANVPFLYHLKTLENLWFCIKVQLLDYKVKNETKHSEMDLIKFVEDIL